jgi:hypothetical protein
MLFMTRFLIALVILTFLRCVSRFSYWTTACTPFYWCHLSVEHQFILDDLAFSFRSLQMIFHPISLPLLKSNLISLHWCYITFFFSTLQRLYFFSLSFLISSIFQPFICRIVSLSLFHLSLLLVTSYLLATSINANDYSNDSCL